MPPFEPIAPGSLREGKNQAKRAEPIMETSELSHKFLFLFYFLRFIRMNDCIRKYRNPRPVRKLAGNCDPAPQGLTKT